MRLSHPTSEDPGRPTVRARKHSKLVGFESNRVDPEKNQRDSAVKNGGVGGGPMSERVRVVV